MGLLAMFRLPVEELPEFSLPTLSVTVTYPGVGPEEIANLITKPLEEQIGTIPGIKHVTSRSLEGVSVVTAEFQFKVNAGYAEQQVRDKVALAKALFPRDNAIEEPSIQRFDPADEPIAVISLQGNMSERELYDLAEQEIKVRLEQIDGIGQIKIIGGRKREIHVLLDREKLKRRQISVTQVSNQLQAAGENIPGGKVSEGDHELLYRSLGEFRSLSDIARTMVSFHGNEIPTKISDLGDISDTLEDELTRSYVNGKKALFLNIYKRSGSNTLAVTDSVKSEIVALESALQGAKGNPAINLIQDTGRKISENVWDVKETILIGIVLTIGVVFLFLGNWRSTIITSLALPNSLLGAFILMSLAGFSINVVSLLALTLAVGLLIDDAIVVRENIFRHLEIGKKPEEAARTGTREVTLAVIATTAAVIAVFGPVAFMSGMMGQFLKQFGLTICFAMVISLFDALTIAPMLSTYFAEGIQPRTADASFFRRTLDTIQGAFSGFQRKLEKGYEKLLRIVLRHPLVTLSVSLVIFAACTATVKKIPMVFIPEQDTGELSVDFEMPPGVNIDAMSRIALAADAIVRQHPEVRMTTLAVGGRDNESNVASMYIALKLMKERSIPTSAFREMIWKEFSKNKLVWQAKPHIVNGSGDGGPDASVKLNLIGNNQQKLKDYSFRLVELMKADPAFRHVDLSYRPGKPEFQLFVKPAAVPIYGINMRIWETKSAHKLREPCPQNSVRTARSTMSEFGLGRSRGI